MGWFPAGHFHHGPELEGELVEAGLADVVVHGVEGPAGLALELVDEWGEDVLAAALLLAERLDQPLARELSNHLLAFGTVPEVG